MLKSICLILNEANSKKKNTLDSIFKEYSVVVNHYIEVLWNSLDEDKKINDKWVKYTDFECDTWFSGQLKSIAMKSATEMIKSVSSLYKNKLSKYNRIKDKKDKLPPKFTMPVYRKNSITFDSRNSDILSVEGNFDYFLKIKSLIPIRNGLSINLPIKSYYRLNDYLSSGWKIKKSFQIMKRINGYFVKFFIEKDEPNKKNTGKRLALDIGYKKLIVTSDEQYLGDSKIYEKISRKKQGSNAFKRALKERDEIINHTCKSINLGNIDTLYVEDLNGVKTGSKDKIRKTFNNKLQR